MAKYRFIKEQDDVRGNKLPIGTVISPRENGDIYTTDNYDFKTTKKEVEKNISILYELVPHNEE